MAHLPFDPSTLSPPILRLTIAWWSDAKPQGAGFGGPYAALMNHPLLCEKIEDLGYFLKFQGHLPREIYQFVVLSVAKSTGAAFEWVDHVKHAEAAGVPSSAHQRPSKGRNCGRRVSSPYDLVTAVLASTLCWKNVPQAFRIEAIKRIGVEGFVELVVLSGFYQMFSAINQGLHVALPPGVENPFK